MESWSNGAEETVHSGSVGKKGSMHMKYVGWAGLVRDGQVRCNLYSFGKTESILRSEHYIALVYMNMLLAGLLFCWIIALEE